jgi:excisionase family DNA binding protein
MQEYARVMRGTSRICAGKEKGLVKLWEVNEMLGTELLTKTQLAARLSVAPRTVQAWARSGKIPAVKITAKVVRFDWQAVVAAIRGAAR